MKRASVYERKDCFFIYTSSRTEYGVWMIDGTCTKLPVEVTASRLGEVVLAALKQSRNVPHPTSWKGITAPVLQAAGVKTWNTFARYAKLAAVELDTELILTPTRNGGVKAGFTDLSEDRALHLPPSASAAEIGEAVMRALALCE